MISTQGTYRVDDPIHLLDLHSIHLSVEFVEVFLDAMKCSTSSWQLVCGGENYSD